MIEINILSKLYNMDDLNLFIESVQKADVSKIKHYVKSNPDLINKKGSSGNTPLHDAVKLSQQNALSKNDKKAMDYQKIAHYFVKHGGDLGIPNNDGEIIQDTKQTEKENIKKTLLQDYTDANKQAERAGQAGGRKKKH